jgi:hypothetical protein
MRRFQVSTITSVIPHHMRNKKSRHICNSLAHYFHEACSAIIINSGGHIIIVFTTLTISTATTSNTIFLFILSHHLFLILCHFSSGFLFYNHCYSKLFLCFLFFHQCPLLFLFFFFSYGLSFLFLL